MQHQQNFILPRGNPTTAAPTLQKYDKPAMAQGEEFLKRPIYVYDVPTALLPTLAPRADTPANPSEPTDTPEPTHDADATATSCTLCSINSKTVADQRAHARSDVHRFNLKRKICGQPAVTEAEFEGMLEGLNESISGSDTSSDESDPGATDPLSTLLKKSAVLSSPDGEPQGALSKKGAGKAPLIWFTSPLLPPSTSLGVYRALFTNTEQADASYLPALHSKQISTHVAGKEPHIFLCMIGGGHFAAMIVSLAPKTSKRHATSVDERQAAVIAHKTFHRYTTRRKQGGAQSSNDAAKGAAHSAGSSLRRYNEQALTAEIRELLEGWKEYLNTAELLFIRATGTANRRTLFGYEGAPMKSNDPRIRGFPFTTRRATQSELTRCFVELTRMKVSRIDEAALATLDQPTAVAPVAKPAKPAPPKLSKEEEAQILHSTQLTALIRRSKAPAVLSYLTSNSLSPDYTFTPATHHTPTLLHLAASSNSPAVVLALLTKAGANPTLTTAEQSKPAFDLSGDRATRDAFRLARTELGETRWDWGASHVPGGLTKQQVDEREKREKEEGGKEEKERREKEVRRLKEEEAERKAASTKQGGRGGRNLGANVQMALGRKEEEERGLTQEARVKLERERRARAAEERIRRMQGGGRGE